MKEIDDIGSILFEIKENISTQQYLDLFNNLGKIEKYIRKFDEVQMVSIHERTESIQIFKNYYKKKCNECSNPFYSLTISREKCDSCCLYA